MTRPNQEPCYKARVEVPLQNVERRLVPQGTKQKIQGNVQLTELMSTFNTELETARE